MYSYFLIVSRQDVPLYEAELSAVKARPCACRRRRRTGRKHTHTSAVDARACPRSLHASQKDDASHLHQFILHAALDFVEERQWDTSNCYLKARRPPAPAARGAADTSADPPTPSPSPAATDVRRRRRSRQLSSSAPRRATRQAVDKFNDLLVSAYVTSGQARLLLLHDGRLHEDGVRAFFGDVHEAYVKARARQQPQPRSAAAPTSAPLAPAQAAMSPFHNGRTPITSARFDALVRGAAKRHLLQ